MPRRRSNTLQRAPRAANTIVADLKFGKFIPKPRNIDRTCAALHAIDGVSPDATNIDVDDIIDHVYRQADSNDEILGPRTKQGIHTALSRLHRNGYIKFLPSRNGEDERIVLTPAFKKVMEELNALLLLYGATREEASDIENYYTICDFFRRKLKPGFKPAYTRRELDLQVRELELVQEEYLQHMRDCHPEQRSPSLAPTEIVDERPELVARDSLYFDDVPQIVVCEPSTIFPTRPSTPVRRSATLNNPEAYPSPESLRRTAPPQHPRTPPQSPSRRSPSIPPPALFGQDFDQDDDDGMDVDVTLVSSPSLPPAPELDVHEECRAEISRLEKKVEEAVAEKRESYLQAFVRSALQGIRLRRVERKLGNTERENETLKAKIKKEERLVALGRKSLVFFADAAPLVADELSASD